MSAVPDSMVGPASARSNAVICNPANNFTTQQYVFENASFVGIVPQPSTGETGFV